jgi:glycosyltransferase involved in cell wall biosynthesis
MTIPSKLLTYFASGRPVVAAAEGETADLVSLSGAGLVCPPDDVEALVAAVRSLREAPSERRDAMGAAAHGFFLSNFRMADLVRRYVSVLLQAASGSGAAG